MLNGRPAAVQVTFPRRSGDARVKPRRAGCFPIVKVPQASEGLIAAKRLVREQVNYRSIWISDVHLGTRHSQVGRLLEFLRQTESEHIYVVGDFIDGWQLRRKWHWADDYNVLIQKLLRKSRKRTRVTFLPGNHDEFLATFLGIHFGAVRLVERTVHTAADGKRYLVLHGHQFDGVAAFNRLLDRVGTVLYDYILDLNLWLNRIRRSLGFGYWSFASYIKSKAKSAVKYVTDYEEAMIQFSRKHGMDGVICGHIHRPEIRAVGGFLYMNCGDWVENCTALVEDFNGNFSLVRFDENPIHSPGRGPGSHDPGDRDERNAPAPRPSGGGGAGRLQPESEPAGVF
jgi:UDP-2,3-diacylglucosamine pyrophosphatase LpxH